MIEETVSPQLLSIHDKEVQCNTPMTLSGKVHLTDKYLILALNIQGVAEVPCTICNETVQQTISIPSFYHVKEIATIKGRVYHYFDCIREAILLEVAFYVECMGNCPKRTELKNYLKHGDVVSPFIDLN